MPRSLGPKIREKFERTLDRVGSWLVYTRSDHRFPCADCVEAPGESARADCSTCWGTGFRTQLERWWGYYAQSVRRLAPTEIPLVQPGWSNEHQPFVFTRSRDVPVVGDRFLIVEWDQPLDLVVRRGAQPLRIVDHLRVVFTEPHMAGEVCFYTAHCQYINETNRQVEPLLLRTPIRVTRE